MQKTSNLILVYYERAERDAAIAYRDSLRAERYSAVVRDLRGWTPRDTELCAAVHVRDADGPVAEAYRALGIPVEVWAPGGAAAPSTPPRPEDYSVQQAGAWYKLIGPDGEQVGKAQRSEDDAWAQVP